MTLIGVIGAGEVGSQIVRAATAAGAATAGEFAVVAVPLKVVNDMSAKELVGKFVLDTNNYMVWRDGHIPVIDSGGLR